ncbi:MAG: CBS domain-containing protein [Anaerolineales bacterium]
MEIKHILKTALFQAGVMYNRHMHVILTHEQADFDAVASLLGAHLLDEKAVPVLPRRMNRNVRAFITLYGLDLPFVDPRDLPKGKIENVTLVDSQSLVTLKGMSKNTKVYVLDHHQRRSDLPKEWQVTTEDIGATATLLIEAMQERGVSLTVPQATLLLLGIYEDTGGLTYVQTTPRDLRAAAFLVEQGANMQILGDFLNHPLSMEQQALYDNLREQVETHLINGNMVMVGCADARETDEELSTIAHKLYDLLDPDALILFIDTSGGTQLIARSTTDLVNVGDLAAHYGGGGHPRAAAALVHEGNAKEICAQVIELLPEYVRPAVTVAEIMSRSPQYLTPDTPIKEADERMRRYGYEGYPVVKEGEVVGLLTRRAVDRTLSHKLNLEVQDVMEAGAATIQPEEPLEALQRLMTDTGWGQVPVVEDGKIVGIVTRTDLIKTLTSERATTGRQNLASRLEATLPPTRLALLQAVAELAQAQGTALYIVGGFVRDLLIERHSIDFDLVVEGDAIELGHAVVEKYGGRVTTHKRFGTAKWQIADIREQVAGLLGGGSTDKIRAEDLPPTLDFVSARREFYTHPTALPTVERGSIKLDLHRRDFTINTLALRLDGHHYGELHDYWGGLADLHAGQVRVLHSLSFVDDPTRILRAVRFEQRFDYQIEDRTLELLVAALPLLDRVSGDRLRHELNIILKEPKGLAMLSRLADLGTLAAIHKDIPWDEDTRSRLALALTNQPEPAWELDKPMDSYAHPLALAYTTWLMALPRVTAASVSGRLRLPGWLTKIVLAACKPLSDISELAEGPPSAVVERVEDVPRMALYAHYLVTKDKHVKGNIEAYISEWRMVRPHTSGHDLREKGIPPGPEYRRILDELRAAWLDGKVDSAEGEERLLGELLKG